jgi:hypothetical protein
MQIVVHNPGPERPTSTDADASHGAPVSRLRTVTGNRCPRKCSSGFDREIPLDPENRLVVDFGAQRPYPACFRENSPDFGSYRGRPRDRVNLASIPGFVPASALLAVGC